MKNRLKNNIYFQLFSNFFKIGMFTIGGGLAMVPLIQREVVEKKHWMSDEEMVDCIAVAQSLPGVVAINTATYVGNFKKGLKGALAASFGVILPSLIVIIAIAMLLEATGDNPYIEGALVGIKGAAAGLIGYSSFIMGKPILKNWFSWIVAIVSFLAILLLDISAVWVIIGGIAIGLISSSIKNLRKEKRGDKR